MAVVHCQQTESNEGKKKKKQGKEVDSLDSLRQCNAAMLHWYSWLVTLYYKKHRTSRDTAFEFERLLGWVQNALETVEKQHAKSGVLLFSSNLTKPFVVGSAWDMSDINLVTVGGTGGIIPSPFRRCGEGTIVTRKIEHNIVQNRARSNGY